MSSNKSARQELERIFGKICMIEATGIRYIPKEQRRKLKGYTKYDDIITYHHIKERQHGGQSTVANGALVRGYNHRWLHALPEEDKEKVNNMLIEFKVSMIHALGDTMSVQEVTDIPLSFDMKDEDCIIIPVHDTKKKDKKKTEFNRAKEKRRTMKQIDMYFEDREDDDWER